MAKQDSQTMNPAAALRAIEIDAYRAYIEWPVVLMCRLREVEKHVAVTAPTPTVVPTMPAQPRIPALRKAGAKTAQANPKSGVKPPPSTTDNEILSLLDSFEMTDAT